MSSSTASPRIVIVKKTGAAARFLHLNTNRGTAVGRDRRADRTATRRRAPSFTFGVAATVRRRRRFPIRSARATWSRPSARTGRAASSSAATAPPITPGNVSSTGGAVLQKPDITAADGVSSPAPAAFRGRSSARRPRRRTPPRSGAVQVAESRLHADAAASALFSTALDIEAPGVDRDSGVGIVMAAAPQPGCTFTMAPPAGACRLPAAPATGDGDGLDAGTCNWVGFSNVPWMTIDQRRRRDRQRPDRLRRRAQHGTGPQRHHHDPGRARSSR